MELKNAASGHVSAIRYAGYKVDTDVTQDVFNPSRMRETARPATSLPPQRFTVRATPLPAWCFYWRHRASESYNDKTISKTENIQIRSIQNIISTYGRSSVSAKLYFLK